MIWLLSVAIIILGVFISLISWIIKFNTGKHLDFNYLDLLGKVGYETYEHYQPITEWLYIDNYLWGSILLGNFGLATIQIGLWIGVCGYIYNIIMDKVRP